ncbi:unnamed protein product [Arabidopsis halleri]
MCFMVFVATEKLLCGMPSLILLLPSIDGFTQLQSFQSRNMIIYD